MRNTLLDIVIVIYVYKLNDKICKKSTESNIEMKHNNFHNTNKISKNHPNVIQTPIFSRSHKRKKTIETTLKIIKSKQPRRHTHERTSDQWKRLSLSYLVPGVCMVQRPYAPTHRPTQRPSTVNVGAALPSVVVMVTELVFSSACWLSSH